MQQQQNNPNNNALSSPGWFSGAPLTRMTAYFTFLAYAIVESQSAHSKLAVDSTSILQQGQFYRFWTGILAFRSSGEIIIGLVLLAHFQRRVEREMGTRKLCMFLLTTFVLSSVFQLIVASMAPTLLQYSGPYPTLGVMIWCFHVHVPRLHPKFVSILGVSISEKALGYMVSAQMMFYRGTQTIVPTVCGMAASAMMLYVMQHIIKDLDFPDWLARMVSTAMKRWVGDDAPLVIVQQQARRGVRAAAAPRPAAAAAPVFAPPAQPTRPPPEAAIEQLTAMGFDRESVLRALQATHNSVERAADRLLSGN